MKNPNFDLSSVVVSELGEGVFQSFLDDNFQEPISTPMGRIDTDLCLQKLENGDPNWLGEFAFEEIDRFDFQEDYFNFIEVSC